jgi:hypothetical protein
MISGQWLVVNFNGKLIVMNTERTDKEEIIFLAEKTKHYCNLLIEQSNNWVEGKTQKGRRGVSTSLNDPRRLSGTKAVVSG